MDFFNPVTLFFLFTLQSVNLYQMDNQLANDLSGHYVRESISEKISTSGCPQSFIIELVSSGNPDLFFLKNEARYQGAIGSQPRILPVDGKTHMLYTGQLVRAEVASSAAIDVHVFNKEIPGERILESFRFNTDGTFQYETKFVDDASEVLANSPQTLCQGTRYKKVAD